MKKMFRKIVVFVVMAAIAALMSTTVFAAGAAKKPFKDVTVQSVGKDAYVAVCEVKKHHGFDGIFEGKKLKPYVKIRRCEFLGLLINYFGFKNVPITEADIKKGNKPITASWAAAKMVAVAKKLGVSITWDEKSKTKLTRVGACQYLKVFTDFQDGTVFKPRR